MKRQPSYPNDAANHFFVETISIDRVDLVELRQEATEGGIRFLERLVDDWARGMNRFNDPGELLVGAFDDGRLVGIAGLNREPYDPAPNVGRLRHLYVLREFRCRGIGKALVARLLMHADYAFKEVRLRTDENAAASFYERLGFERATAPTATHRIVLRGRALVG